MPIGELGALRVVNRDAWVKKVKAAMRSTKGRVPEAAEELGVSRRLLFRWLEEPDFEDINRSAVGLRRDRKPREET